MGFSQKHVAKLIGHKDTSTISRWEKGVTLPTVDNLFKLAYLYHTLPDELYYDLRAKCREDIELRQLKRRNANVEVPISIPVCITGENLLK